MTNNEAFVELEGCRFKIEIERPDGLMLFVRLEPDDPDFGAAKAKLEQLAASGAWVELGKPYRATEARVLDMRVGQTGTLRARLELRIMWDAGVAWLP